MKWRNNKLTERTVC